MKVVPGRLLALARKESIQLRRDPRSLAMAFVLPVVLVLLFGYAISFDVDHIPLAVHDGDHSVQSRALVDAFRASGSFDLVATLARQGQADEVLTTGRALMVLNIPPGYGAAIVSGEPATVQALVDGSDANTAAIAVNYAEATSRGTTAALIVPEIRVWYNETLDSRLTIVPGLVAVIMMIIAAMLTSLTLSREWERGTMEQLAATPVHPLEVILGKLLPYLAIGLFDMAVTVVLGLVIFEVPFRGSYFHLLLASVFFLVGGLGLGIFVSAVLRSQLLATQVSMLVTYLPGFLLSGFAFDIANMPAPLQAISYLVPARYFITITRGIFLKGVGPSVFWRDGIAMAAYAIIGLALAARAFRKTIPD